MTDFNNLDEETMAQKADEVVQRVEEVVQEAAPPQAPQQQPGGYSYSYQPPQPVQQGYTPPQAPQPPQQSQYTQRPPVGEYQGQQPQYTQQPPVGGYQGQQPQYTQQPPVGGYQGQQPQYTQQQYGQPPYNPASPYGYQQKSKLVAGLLGILLGGLGIHNFYLGFTTRGIIQIVVTLLTCGVAGIWGFIEGILYLCGSMNVDANGVYLKE